jgi:hypothetical protein
MALVPGGQAPGAPARLPRSLVPGGQAPGAPARLPRSLVPGGQAPGAPARPARRRHGIRGTPTASYQAHIRFLSGSYQVPIIVFGFRPVLQFV